MPPRQTSLLRAKLRPCTPWALTSTSAAMSVADRTSRMVDLVSGVNVCTFISEVAPLYLTVTLSTISTVHAITCISPTERLERKEACGAASRNRHAALRIHWQAPYTDVD